MAVKALILDLDNTIYPVHSIGDRLFAGLFEVIEESGEGRDRMDLIRREIMRRPYQVVAREFGFSDALLQKGIGLLKEASYQGPIAPFPDYKYTREIMVDKFLVTTGFVKLQESKIDGMGIREDFLEIHIVDPLTSARTKKDVFAEIMHNHGYDRNEILVVGDDPASEIKAALDLSIPVVLYDALDLHADIADLTRITSFMELKKFYFDQTAC